jgi:hypothetical protein
MDHTTARMMASLLGRHGSELTSEQADADAAELDAYLALHPDCAALVRADKAIDDRMAVAMKAVDVPAGLKAKILDATATQRGSWFRNRAIAGSAVAATVFLGIGGVIGYQILNAPTLHLESIVAEADDPRGEVDRLFRGRSPFNPERPFNMNLMATAGMSKFQGRDVPTLYFLNVSKNAHAKVHVVRDNDFHWKGLRDRLRQNPAQVSSIYGNQVAILEDALRGDVGYIVIFTGDTIDLFLDDRSGQ